MGTGRPNRRADAKLLVPVGIGGRDGLKVRGGSIAAARIHIMPDSLA